MSHQPGEQLRWEGGGVVLFREERHGSSHQPQPDRHDEHHLQERQRDHEHSKPKKIQNQPINKVFFLGFFISQIYYLATITYLSIILQLTVNVNCCLDNHMYMSKGEKTSRLICQSVKKQQAYSHNRRWCRLVWWRGCRCRGGPWVWSQTGGWRTHTQRQAVHQSLLMISGSVVYKTDWWRLLSSSADRQYGTGRLC